MNIDLQEGSVFNPACSSSKEYRGGTGFVADDTTKWQAVLGYMVRVTLRVWPDKFY